MSNKAVYILRGMGIGVVLMAVVMTFVPAKMTNTQIKAEAKKLGMVEAYEVSKTEEKLNSILGNETKTETETKSEDKIDDKNEDKQNDKQETVLDETDKAVAEDATKNPDKINKDNQQNVQNTDNKEQQDSNTLKTDSKEQQDSNTSKTDENTEEVKMTGPGEDV